MPAAELGGTVEVPDEGLPPEQTPAARAAAPVPAVAARQGGGAGSGGGRGGRGSLGGFFGAIGRHPFRLVGGLVAVLVIWFRSALFQPFHGDGSGKVAVTVPKGSSVSEVGDLLDKKGPVIDSSTLFQVRVTLAGKRSELYAGPLHPGRRA